MLYIVFDSGRERTWHVGEPLPITDAEVFAVKMIQADGDELKHIQDLFHSTTSSGSKTIPMPYDRRVAKWYGDIAKTIIGNCI